MLFPRLILFDWHGTLVDTLDAMYSAMEEMLPALEELGLVEQLVPETECHSPNDAKLVRYIRIYRKLHPKILAERRVSRTEIFNAVFGDNTKAKRIAHLAYNQCYRHHFGEVHLFEPGVYEYLKALKTLGIKLGIATNRSREFLLPELELVDSGRLQDLFDCIVCADDVPEYKPEPDVIHEALRLTGLKAGADIWYVGDSPTDMKTARNAEISAVFYSGAREVPDEELEETRPDGAVESFEALMSFLAARFPEKSQEIDVTRPPPFPPHVLPPPRIEPDWHPSVASLTPPKLVLFDWHATLADTLDAMYHAVDDLLQEFDRLGLTERMVKPENSRSPNDAKLVEHVKNYQALHPKVKADRKISRTDIFEVLFGDDQEAKQIAHRAFTGHYRNYFGQVLPFEPRILAMLKGLKGLGLPIGVITNRDREFFEVELKAMEDGLWMGLFDTVVCGDDTELRKPHPDPLLKSVGNLEMSLSSGVWYVGDSTTDTISAKTAGITSVFFNGAQWDLPWLQKIFPGDARFPHKPDVVVNDFSEFWALVLTCLSRLPEPDQPLKPSG